MCRLVFIFIFTSWMISGFITTSPALAVDAGEFSEVLKKIDKLVCANPEKISQYYGSELVIMIDDKRTSLENRIKDYRQMMSEYVGMKCSMTRKVLSGRKGEQVGYVLVDEQISVTAESVHIDERQHSVCSYMFSKEKDNWKISLEHCSSLPDYTIRPGEDALYYFHNPVY
ncbi:MAG: hypothetical protein MK238_00585 [Nitrospinales bacterium]|nr:hypothetical protein [Nitrospinales bacterium]